MLQKKYLPRNPVNTSRSDQIRSDQIPASVNVLLYNDLIYISGWNEITLKKYINMIRSPKDIQKAFKENLSGAQFFSFQNHIEICTPKLHRFPSKLD